MYDALLDALAGREAFSINLPGRAGTDGPALRTAGEMAEYLSGFIASEVDGDHVVAGHSLGGAVALEYALGAPAGLQGLVLLATGARLRVHPTILQLYEQLKESGVEIPALPPGLFEQGTGPALIDKATKDRALTPIETGGADWRAADSFDRMQDLDKIQVPALIVVGTSDALTPAKYAEYMATHIPDSELHVIEGAGHMLVMERAGEIAGWIQSFVERIS